ncbi:hypothetical protein [Pararcticibacter amylolyticus]|uniref:Uncharacterized protein n=1 Tax=Pararcticibacter amylolyticus TaxID=2173175 RepID=A0A2U2P9E4_9SPHI|nr:hypothetical protein [Pararcticibacter amylolyticus]PWG77990.1 hypothetical protein DDR33_24565 [Pararcticibacter amylolyticus]
MYFYASTGRILSFKVGGGPFTSYCWGYDDLYPIAEVRNASVSEFYFADFEGNSGFDGYLEGDYIRSHTGLFSGRISNDGSGKKNSSSNTWLETKTLKTRTIRYSGWVFSTGPTAEIALLMRRAGETNSYSYVDTVILSAGQLNKWVLLQKEIEVPLDVSQVCIQLSNNSEGSVWFDDIRLYPANAQMSTYTYKPLVGVKSRTNDVGQTVYYEYDNYQRLRLIQDQNRKVLKEYQYRYK